MGNNFRTCCRSKGRRKRKGKYLDFEFLALLCIGRDAPLFCLTCLNLYLTFGKKYIPAIFLSNIIIISIIFAF